MPRTLRNRITDISRTKEEQVRATKKPVADRLSG
jgi:hypothetical protein